jgi:spore germination protein YaaH
MVWLEDTYSMGWRMDMVNNYGLAGAAGWDMNWNPSGDILYVIKSKLK